MKFEKLFEIPPYSPDKEEKGRILDERLSELTGHHREHCPAYAGILELEGIKEEIPSYKKIPYLPDRWCRRKSSS